MTKTHFPLIPKPGLLIRLMWELTGTGAFTATLKSTTGSLVQPLVKLVCVRLCVCELVVHDGLAVLQGRAVTCKRWCTAFNCRKNVWFLEPFKPFCCESGQTSQRPDLFLSLLAFSPFLIYLFSALCFGFMATSFSSNSRHEFSV